MKYYNSHFERHIPEHTEHSELSGTLAHLQRKLDARRRRLKKALLWTAGISSAAAILGGILIYRHYLPPIPKRRSGRYPYAIVLGCPNHDDGTYSTSQILRCRAAIDAYQEGLYDKLIVTGAAVKNKYVEAREMADFIEAQEAIPVEIEDASRNTWQNLANSRRLTGDVPVLIITSSSHARRAAAMASRFYTSYALYTYPERRPKHWLKEIPSRLLYTHLEIQKDLKKLQSLSGPHEQFRGEDLLTPAADQPGKNTLATPARNSLGR